MFALLILKEVEIEAGPVNAGFSVWRGKKNRDEPKKMSLSPKEIEDGEDEMLEDRNAKTL